MEQQKKGVPVWLVIVAVGMFVMVGIATPLAIYGVSKYMKTAKAAEAQATLAAWGKGLAECGEREGKLPASTRPVPALLTDVKGKKYQSAPTDWIEHAHTCAGFTFSGPQYFQYRWEQQSDQAGNLHAVADLDGDSAIDLEARVDVSCVAGKCSASAVSMTGEGGSVRAAAAAPSAEESPAAASSGSGELGAGRMAGIALLLFALLVQFGAHIWILVLGFQESVGWGLIMFFMPCTQWFFIYQFWDRAKRPFLLWAGAFGAMVVAFAIVAVLDPKRAASASTIAAADASAGPHLGQGVRLPPPPRHAPVPELTGAPADLSTVMGKARKLANQWEPDAALVGIEATLVSGLVQTTDGGSAKLTFGPAPFASVKPKSGSFVVTYDQSGISGAPSKAAAGKALPEPMCGPEAVYTRVAAGESPRVTLRYGFEPGGRAAWMVTLAPSAPPRLFEPQRCDVMASAAARPR